MTESGSMTRSWRNKGGSSYVTYYGPILKPGIQRALLAIPPIADMYSVLKLQTTRSFGDVSGIFDIRQNGETAITCILLKLEACIFYQTTRQHLQYSECSAIYAVMHGSSSGAKFQLVGLNRTPFHNYKSSICSERWIPHGRMKSERYRFTLFAVDCSSSTDLPCGSWEGRCR